MYQKPIFSPWGCVEVCDALCPGVFQVGAEDGVGTLVALDVSAALSPAARRCGFRVGRYLCYEEYQEDVVLRELLDKGLWRVPARVRDKAAFVENIDRLVRAYSPAYWRSRQRGREAARAEARPAPVLGEAR